MAALTPPAEGLSTFSSPDAATPTEVPTISTSPVSTISFTTSPTPDPTPFLYFTPLSTVPTCSQVAITWQASGPLSNLSIFVAYHNINSPLSTTIPGSDSVDILQLTIATGLNPTSNLYIWNPVRLPAGTYYLIGSVTGLSALTYSSQFSVSNSSDTSCLTGTLPASAASASSSKSNMAGAIAGGVIGGLALAGILIALFLFWRVYRASKRGRRAGGSGHGTMRNWTGLSSRDSGLGVASLPSYTKKSAHYQRGGGQTHPSDSTNKILSANNSTIGHSTEDVCSLATSSLEAEKLPKHYSRGSFDFIDTIQPLSYTPNTRRRSSITISTTLTGTAPTPDPHVNMNGTGPLTRSSSQHRSSTLAKLEAADGGNGNNARRYQHRQSLDGRNLSHPMDAPAHIAATSPGLSSMLPSHLSSSSSPSTPADLAPAPLAIGRSASGGASARRANRKPVPTYDASSLEMEDSPISGSPSSYGGYGYGGSPLDRSNSTSSSRRGYPPVSPSTPTTLNNPQTQAPAMYANPKANYSNASGRSGTLGVGYGNGLDVEDVRLAAMAAAGLDVPSLNHKSSFGDGRPVHYLIPDMPPPQKD